MAIFELFIAGVLSGRSLSGRGFGGLSLCDSLLGFAVGLLAGRFIHIAREIQAIAAAKVCFLNP